MLAARDDDRELDTALVSLGVLPPLDLADIRAWLSLPDIDVRAGANRDGHRVLDVAIGNRVVARIHHDGCVVPGGQALLLATA